MRSTGIVRRIDDLGRIVIPKEIRKVFKIREGDAISIHVNEDSIILRKEGTSCAVCGLQGDELDKLERVEIGFEDTFLCKGCEKELKKHFETK